MNNNNECFDASAIQKIIVGLENDLETYNVVLDSMYDDLELFKIEKRIVETTKKIIYYKKLLNSSTEIATI